eukprot:TRINITY_DN214_c0_g1_i5.p2 TRINITY_DN214_c0_g1~~TRINITY_DN214_c0_g1_i5.p2  ORF type:complete len:100 (-),score=46.87 TRINITY_DN214_c0_g1_i5:129-428(-)
MNVEVEIPNEYQGNAIGILSRRRGAIRDTQLQPDGDILVIRADVPLSQMFGFSTELRSVTTGKGEYSMEFSHLQQVDGGRQMELQQAYQKQREEDLKKK